MKAISFIKKHAMVVLAGAAIIGFSSFKVIELNKQNKDTDLIFTYVPPAGSPAPYSDTNVKNTSNWQRSTSDCSASTEQEVACSIAVPATSTMNGGNNIDPSKVTIETFQHSTNNYGVSPSSAATPQYNDPLNRPLEP
ncbi:hypothetical protein [Sphingobacterium sp. DR205]|uniref:hypothetical protein n=1 Tax=Sphingobacterium sp. DR205 TaxID=2713573 RepID=UPI0013E5113A|nr:hypothetical protein [Sphingobacterium sp. DR205]QIH35260.1 hypothetical protein G6053_21315 [Sphingobacterium sp. DR205]